MEDDDSWLPRQLVPHLAGLNYRAWRPTEGEELPVIDNGVLFVCATWSGPAIYRGRMLTDALRAGDRAATLLVVVDSDSLSASAWKTLGARPGGYGETFWFEGGRIVSREPRPIDPNLRPEVPRARTAYEQGLRREYRRALVRGDEARAKGIATEIRSRFDAKFS